MHPANVRIFHAFLGIHSLLIGVFPFFIPVYLWKHGYGLGELSMFVSVGGLGFCFGLCVWDRLRSKIDLISMIALSLLLEILLLLNAYALDFDMTVPILLLFGGCFGVYNSFFWTTQRALFVELITPENSGRKYGNFQLFVGALLQIGILLGGVLLERNRLIIIILVSVFIAVVGFLLLWSQKCEYPRGLRQTPPLTFLAILRFRDRDASRPIFLLDGAYLFLESYFWVISLFLIARESFTTLGIMVLSLAVIFGILFYLLKNSIDKLGKKRVYRLAVLLYAVSWGLRALTDEQASLEWLFVLLVLITFNTSIFRLVFNKRFYDLAKLSRGHAYLILKSYYSQFAIFLGFLGFAIWVTRSGGQAEVLMPVYWVAAVLSLGYLGYGAKRYR